MKIRHLLLQFLICSTAIMLACSEEVISEIEESKEAKQTNTFTNNARLAEGQVVAIESPEEGSIIPFGSSFTVKGIIDDTIEIDACRLWINGVFHSLDKEAPYEFEVADLPLGTHTLMVRAKDSDDINYDSEVITISVEEVDNVGTIEITSITNGDTFNLGSDIQIVSNAYDEDTVKNVRLWIDNEMYELSTEAPFDFTINHLEEGSHTIFLRMKDEKDYSITSETITINIVAKEIIWDDFAMHLLEYERINAYQDIIFQESKIGTTEFLILSASHGNPEPGTRLQEAEVQGGGWTKVGYGGDDDKSAEVWMRQVTSSNQNDLGQIDSNNAAAKLAILSYDGLINSGIVQELYFFKEKISIDHGGATGPFLIIAATDNGRESTNSNLNYGYKDNGNVGDDMTMIYLTHDDEFYDNSYKLKGGLVSIQLVN